GGPLAHLVVAPRCPGCVRRRGGGAPSLQPGGPRAVPACLHDRTGGRRVHRLRPLLDRAGADGRPVDGLLVTNATSIRWLSGFTGSAGLLLVTGDHALLTSDGRDRTQAFEQLSAVGVDADIEIRIGGVHAQREALVAESGAIRSFGLEADHVTWSAQRSWDDLFVGIELLPTRGLVEGLRMAKDAGEVARMERAAAIADEALADVLPLLPLAGRRAG